jgi:hypothetical protein
MKTLQLSFFFLILFSLSSIKSNAQEIKYSDLSTITKNGNYTSYVSKDGTVYNIGDKLTVGSPSSNKTFAFISYNYGSGWVAAGVISVGNQIEIKKIEVDGNKRVGYRVLFSNNRFMNSTLIAIENAIASGEIKSFGMTSDEALNNLKKAKDKLDLGLITQQKYDSIKTELVKFIK